MIRTEKRHRGLAEKPLRKTDRVLLVRKRDVTIFPDQDEETNILEYGVNQLAERGCEFLSMRMNDTMVAYAGRPYNRIKR